ncbi:MAG: Glycosyl transferase group 1 [candidate division WS6 bacterium 34_10]|uniref:Glycosyl transferase group 1 n=1 Tax=candidate division WS6 bacterium 34_10 TaxID=1641389 RepID=A0A101HIT6_9BACT|nr:MAG: Glycosyl transferase group 1 [candidate division WS6 bacterium 34_10]
MLKDKNLLILSHTYNSFIKDPVEILAKRFNKIYVLVRHQPISELGNIIPLPFFKNRAKYSKKYSIDLTDKPDNVEVIPVSFFYLPNKNIYLKAGPRHAREVIKTIEKEHIEFDLIHAHFAWSAGYAGVKVSEKYKKPLIVTGHGYDLYKLPLRSERFKEAIKGVFNKADQVLTVSNKNKEHILNMGVKNDVKVFPNGYTKELFYYKEQEECRKKLGLPLDRNIIFTIGHLEVQKGYEYLVKALKIVKEKNPDILCLHIGAGSLEGEIKELVKELDLEENIKFLGRKPHNTLVDYFGASDFFVSSSLVEGNPTVMFEALGCGKPFVGTKVGGVPEIIESEDYGLLCEAKDVKCLADNILKALDKDWDKGKILEYSKKFTWSNITEKIAEIYEKLLK